MTTPWRHGRRWMFRKRNSISKRSYKRTGRTSSERPSFDEKSLYQPETLAFHPPNIQQGTSIRLRLPSASAVRVSALSCPCVPHPTAGSPFSWIAPCALHDSRTATCPTTAVPTCSRAAPASSGHRGRRTASPLSRSRDKITPRKPKTGTCHPCQSKSFTERGGPEEGDAFPKAPSSPGKQAPLRKNYSSASVSASPAASSEAGPARGASATERSGIRHCPGRGAVSSAFSPT